MYEERKKKPQENWEPSITRREVGIAAAGLLILGCLMLLGFCAMIPPMPARPGDDIRTHPYGIVEKRVEDAFAAGEAQTPPQPPSQQQPQEPHSPALAVTPPPASAATSGAGAPQAPPVSSAPPPIVAPD